MQQKSWLKFRIDIFYELKYTGVFSDRLFYVEFNRGRRAIGVRPPVLKLRCAFPEAWLSFCIYTWFGWHSAAAAFMRDFVWVSPAERILSRSELSAVEMFCVVLGDFSNDNQADCTPNNNPEILVCLGTFPSTVVDDVRNCLHDVLRLQNRMYARPETFSLSILIQEMGGWWHGTSLLKAFPLGWLSPAWRLIVSCRKSWVHFSECRNVILLRVKSLVKRFICVLHDSHVNLQKCFPICVALFKCFSLIRFMTLIINNRNRFLNSRVTRCLSKLSAFVTVSLKSESRACSLRNCVISLDRNPSSNHLLSAASRCSILAVGQPSLCNIRNACSYSIRVSFSFWRRASKCFIDSLVASNISKRRASPTKYHCTHFRISR